MKGMLARFYDYLDRPLRNWGRILLLAALIPLAFAFTQPLWRISMEAAQYPAGLHMDVYAFKLEGGNNGQHIQEINTLNHYIGMHKIDRAALSDLDWMPFALGILFLLTLRVVAIGNVRALIDLAVLTFYVSGFALARFVYKLYIYGHDLDPTAPVKVAPFMPVVIGTKQVANFTTHSWPQLGSVFMGAFVLVLVGVTVWHLWAGRVAAARLGPAPATARLAM